MEPSHRNGELFKYHYSQALPQPAHLHKSERSAAPSIADTLRANTPAPFPRSCLPAKARTKSKALSQRLEDTCRTEPEALWGQTAKGPAPKVSQPRVRAGVPRRSLTGLQNPRRTPGHLGPGQGRVKQSPHGAGHRQSPSPSMLLWFRFSLITRCHSSPTG